jgi:hypothetical protein
MVRLGISLNDVMRDFIGQLEYVYMKYYDNDFEIDYDTIVDFDNLHKYFNFKTKKEFYKFIYEDAPLEVFGHASQKHDNLFNDFNNFILDIEDFEEPLDVIVVSREFSTSIPSTYFFLSKVLCKSNKVIFYKEYEDVWKHVDILITANPIEISNKPIDKVVIKSLMPYNKNIIADYTLEDVREFFNDYKFRNKIIEEKKLLS